MTFGRVLDGVRAGAVFRPSKVPDLVLDLDGDAGLTTANVNKLFDATPNAHTATQDTSTLRPSLIQNDPDFNGKASLDFNANALQAVDSVDFELGAGLTIYIVQNTPPPIALRYLLAKRASTSTDTTFMVRSSSTAGDVSLVTRNSANTANYTVNSTDIAFDGTTKIVRVRHTAGVENGIRVDSGAEVTAAAPDEIASSASPLTIMSLNSTPTATLLGKVARILIYKESIPSGSVADLAIMAELDALYKGVGSPTGLLFEGEGNLVADFNPEVNAGLATAAWADQSVGVAHDATQATAAKQAALLLSDPAFNGHGSVTGDGVDDFLQIPDHADLAAAGGYTIYLVRSLPDIAPGIPHTNAYGKRDPSFTGPYWEWNFDTGKSSAYLRTTAGNQIASTAFTTPLDTNTPRVTRTMYDASGARLYHRHSGIAEVSVAVAGTPTDSASALIVFAGNSGGSRASKDTIARFLIYSRAVTAAEDARIMAYLNARYHIGYSGFTLGYSNGFG